jgi:hypothetical protein
MSLPLRAGAIGVVVLTSRTGSKALEPERRRSHGMGGRCAFWAGLLHPPPRSMKYFSAVVEHLVDVQNERSTRLGSAAFAMRRLWRTAL